MQLDVSSVKEGKFSENATSKTIQINAWAHTSERRIPLISKCGAQKLEGTGNTWWMKLIPPRKKKYIYTLRDISNLLTHKSNIEGHSWLYIPYHMEGYTWVYIWVYDQISNALFWP